MLFNKKKNVDASTSGENAIESRETAGLSQGQIVLRRFVRHRVAMFALFSLMAIIIFVYSASGLTFGSGSGAAHIPGWWKYSFDTTDIPALNYDGCPITTPGCATLNLNPFNGPITIGDHPFGQDDIGRDYFSLVMRGAEQSILVMVVVGLVGGFLGTVLGALSGFYRGFIDSLIMRFTDLIITIPSIIVGAVIGFKFGNLGVLFLAFYLGMFSWTGLARLVRGEFLTLREREFVDAARVAGASNRRIIFKHILPNAVGVIIVSTTLLMSGAILLESALSYLGFGVLPPDVSLGSLISQYQTSFVVRPWLFWWPGLFIISIALCVNFIGDGLRDAFDPRQKRRITAKDRARAAKIAAEQA